jgi:hypothetical protein
MTFRHHERARSAGLTVETVHHAKMAAMITMPGGFGVVLHIDRDVSYGQVESALQSEAFLDGYLIDRANLVPEQTQLHISIHIPIGMITASGVPPLEAITALRSLASALETLDAAGI